MEHIYVLFLFALLWGPVTASAIWPNAGPNQSPLDPNFQRANLAGREKRDAIGNLDIDPERFIHSQKSDASFPFAGHNSHGGPQRWMNAPHHINRMGQPRPPPGY